jgi:hypothetical protein
MLSGATGFTFSKGDETGSGAGARQCILVLHCG